MVERTEAKEATEAEVRSLVAANRALEADMKKVPAPSLWEGYPFFEELSPRMKLQRQMRKLEDMDHCPK